METSPLISIITITYNAEDNILPTLESVAEQTYRNFEHIIVDGASSDRTLTVARQFADTRILSEKDNGISHAENTLYFLTPAILSTHHRYWRHIRKGHAKETT